MTGPQVGYLVVTGLYVIFFVVFLRMFGWKRFAERRYWHRRPVLTREKVREQAAGQQVPFISLFVPAREEAEVIAATLEHLSRLDYPADRYEVIVITDAKEAEAAVAEGRRITTQSVVAAVQAARAGRLDLPQIVHAEVPVDYDGLLGGKCVGTPVRSTKGRALNWGVAFANPQATVFGFYDAESRPDPQVLLQIAYRALTVPEPLLLQGPVFQVRNFYKLNPMNKLAALYQCVSHEWNLPMLMQALPFIGGTNFYSDADLFRRIGGADQHALTEDLEFGVRAYLAADIWPDYLPVAGSEQTPEKLQHFFRQRLRWGSGYLDVMEKYRAHELGQTEKGRQLMKTLIWRGPVQWTVYQLVCLMMPVIWFMIYMGWLDSSALPDWANMAMSSTALIYLGFTFWLFGRYRPYMDESAPLLHRIAGTAQLILLPLGAFVLPTPYSWALVLRLMGRQPQTWVKTPRTAEQLPGSPAALPNAGTPAAPGLQQQGD